MNLGQLKEEDQSQDKQREATLVNELIQMLSNDANCRILTQKVLSFIGSQMEQECNFPQDILVKAQDLKALLIKKSQEQLSNLKQYILKTIQKIIQKDKKRTLPRLWEVANILLQLDSVRSLSGQFTQKIITIFQEGNSQTLKQHFQELFKQNADLRLKFDEQISNKMFNGRSLYNLKTLISQTFLTKPVKFNQNSLIQRLKTNCENMGQFHGQIIQIIDENLHTVIEGKIQQVIHAGENQFQFKVCQGKNNKYVKLCSKNGSFIDFIEFERQKIVSLREYIKGSTSFQKRIYLQNNINFHISNIIPSGECILRKIIEQASCYLLQFITNSKLYEYQIALDQLGKPKNVKNLKTKQTYTDKQFFDGYLVKEKQIRQIRYNSQEESDRSIKIVKHIQSRKDTIQLIENINSRKDKGIKKFLCLQQKILHKLLRKLIYQQNILMEDLNQIGIDLDIPEIRNLYKQLGSSSTQQSILRELLTEVNYISLVSKENLINSIRTVQLFAKSESYTKTMKGKDVIYFYGRTGSGKSTAINYFRRIPLKKTINQVGDCVVQVDQKYVVKQEEGEQCKIGHSNGISETLYSQGFAIPKEKLNKFDCEELNKMILCDNPGYNDTRGTSYQICTNLSMDMAIQASQSIKAIILVVPHSSIDLDKFNHLISLISLMQERFPSLLEDKSSVFNRFFILISKASDDQKISTLTFKIQKLIEQHRKIAIKMEKDRSDLHFIFQRLRIFQALYRMCIKKKIDFINIQNDMLRDQLLEKYMLDTVSISKNQYARNIDNNQMTRQFSNEISVVAHTWMNLILKPYFQTIPKTITLLKESIQSIESVIMNQKKENTLLNEGMMQQNRLLEENQYKVQLYKLNLERLQREDFTEEEKQRLENNDIQVQIPESGLDDQLKKMLIQNKNKVQKEKQKNQSLQHDLKRIKKKMTRLNSEKNNMFSQLQKDKSRIKEWKSGKTQNIVYSKYAKLGQKITIGVEGFSRQERLEYLRQGKRLPQRGSLGSFIVGKQKIQLCDIIKIKKSYNLLPSSQFDPNSYINKINNKYGKFNAKITSQGYILEGANLINEGKTVLLSVLQTYPFTNHQSQLPFIKITHSIPNIEYFSAQIVNAESDNRNRQKRIEQINKNIFSLQNKKNECLNEITSNQDTISSYEQKIKNITQLTEKAKQKRRKQLKVQNRQEKIKIIIQQARQECDKAKKKVQIEKERIVQISRQQTKINKKISELQKIKKEQQEKYEYQMFKRQRFEFLIRNQMLKNIPQSIKQFIKIAKESSIQSMKTKNFIMQNIEEDSIKIKNFDIFLKYFNSVEPRLIKIAHGEKMSQQKIPEFQQNNSQYFNYEQKLPQNDKSNSLMVDENQREIKIEHDVDIYDGNRPNKKVKTNLEQQ